MWDADGNRLLDYVQSYGASILGHAHPGGGRRGAGGGRTRDHVRRPDRGRGAAGRGDPRPGAGCEQVRLVSSGTEATMSVIRVARGFTGRDRDRQVRRVLPRPLRRPAGRWGQRRGDPRAARLGGGARRGGGRHRGRPVQRGPRARRPGGLRDRRGGGRQHGPGAPGAGIPRGTPGGVRRRRGPAGLRRGDHRVPSGRGRGGGVERRPTGPVVLRQGHRRGPAGRGLRRPGGRAGGPGPARAGVPGGHAVREPAGHRGRAARCSTS